MYVAIQSFKAANGTIYRMGDIIDSDAYALFSARDKVKCKIKMDGNEIPKVIVEEDSDFDLYW